MKCKNYDISNNLDIIGICTSTKYCDTLKFMLNELSTFKIFIYFNSY